MQYHKYWRNCIIVNRRDSRLCDFLFAIVFGATFSFKLQMLHDMGMNPFTEILEYVGFFVYSLGFVFLYWMCIRPVEKESWYDPISSLVPSVAPYPALQISLWIHGICQPIYDPFIVILIMFQVVYVLVYRKLVNRKRRT